MKKVIYLITVLFVASCTVKKTPTAAITEAAKKVEAVSTFKSNIPGYTVVDFERGKTIYESKCGACHPLKSPYSQTPTGWQNWVPKMVVLVNQKAGIPVLNGSAQQDIYNYLITASSPTK